VIVTLLTDYGPGSEHVGALHAVLAREAPGAERVDLAHDLAAGDVRAGALALARLASLLPAAVHLAVVDPGVGTDRRPAAVSLSGGGALVGPDNGLPAPAADALGAVAAVALTPLPPEAAATFHGRDLFAPAAARLALGVPAHELGESFDPAELVRPDLPPARANPGALEALAVGADRFGNLQLLAGPGDLAGAGLARGERVGVSTGDASHPATVARAFGDVPPGDLLVYVDSHGMVAVARNGGSAAERLGSSPGATVRVARAT
jgi:S-adenosyl-L-methionine hydrolase (adenosine-forming)